MELVTDICMGFERNHAGAAASPEVAPSKERAPTILVVEDDHRMRRYLRSTLGDHGLRVIETRTGSEALEQASAHNPELVVLDFGLPDMDGLAVTKKLREWTAIPILLVSARHEESEKLAAFAVGANDYVTKPFATGELLARIRVWLRESQRVAGAPLTTVIEVGPIRVDLARRVVELDGEEIRLPLTEYKLLAFMARNADKVLTHDQILLAVWGPRYTREKQYLRVYMGRLRQRFEDDPARPRYFVTEQGVGYRLRSGS
jgi:two-component system KDP operon response regulator KdpE